MLVTLLILLITSNAVINDRNKSILYSRMLILGLIFSSYIVYSNLFIKPLEKGVGLYGGMFNVTAFTQSFNLFIIVIVSIIAILTAYYPLVISSITIFDVNTRLVYRNINYKNIYSINKEQVVSPNQLSKDTAESNISLDNKVLSKLYDNTAELIYKDKSGQFSVIEYALVTLFILCGAIFLMSTGDLISMFLSIELQSYGLYILCTLYRDSEDATNSGLMYFLLGGMSSCFILFGSALIYVNSGTTNLDNIYILNSLNEIIEFAKDEENTIQFYNSYYIGISLVILIVGFLFKVSAAPFHFWSPDVYDGIPTIVTTFVAIVAKISIFVFILQLVLNIDYSVLDKTYTLSIGESFKLEWKNILIFSSLMSLIIGSLLGLTQYRIKRLLAYSTISHVGFILLGLSVSTIESIQGYIFYILQYSITNINTFFILIAIGFTLQNNIKNSSFVPHHLGRKDVFTSIKESPIQYINQLKGYFYINSYISISLAITFFSFVGVPPLIGFFAKQMILSAALDEGYIFITLIAVLTSVIGAVYYLNVIRMMFFSSSKNDNYNYTNKLFSNMKDKLSNKNDYTLSTKEETKEFYLKLNRIFFNNIHYKAEVRISSALSIIITILTLVILTFILVPSEWLRVASILSITLFKV